MTPLGAKSKAASMGLVGLFIVLYILPLGIRPLVIPDEARYGEIPREMLVSGDWIVPHLDGMRYFEKPVLGYWLNAVSIRLLGENAFAIRLPSAIAAGLTAWLLFLWSRRFSDDEITPLFGTAVFLLSFEVLAIGTFAVLDSFLSLFITAAVVAFYFAHQQETPGKRALWLVLAGIACGLAFLTKGFLALVIPVLVIVPFSLWQGQFKTLLKRAWIILVPAVLVVLPWAVMIHRREPDFWHYFFWVEHVNRFISPHGGQHPQPFWFYVPNLLWGALPWTPLIGSIVVGVKHTNWKHPMIRLAICWLVLPFLFFSACSGKLLTYILPCYPPLAFLISVGVLQCLREEDTEGFVVGARVLLCGACLVLLAVPLALIILPRLTEQVSLWKWAVAVAGLYLWIMMCWAAITRKEIHKKLLFYCAGPVLLMFSWPLIIPAALSTEKMPGMFLSSHAAKVSGDSVLVTENALAAAVCWYYERDDVFIVGGTGEYEYGLNYEDSRHRNVNIEQLSRMISESDETGCVILLARSEYYVKIKDQLPNPSYEEMRDDLVWSEYTPRPYFETPVGRLSD